MHIVFIPPVINPIFTEDYENYTPLGLLALSSSLEINGYKSYIYKASKRLLDNDAYDIVANEILALNCNIIGFSTYCNSFPASLILAERIKIKNPNAIIIFGGPHASLLYNEIMKEFNYVDFILRGEADLSIVNLISTLTKNEIQNNFDNISGVTYRNSSNEIINTAYDIKNLINLDTIPIPKYDVAELNGHADIDVGRGCPFNCVYCCTNNFFSRRFRVKSVKRIIQEIHLLYSNYNVKSFSFSHDMFTLNKVFIREFCHAFINYQDKQKEKMVWTCSARIDTISEELLECMADAGCNAIFFGIESGSKDVQKYINKNLNLETVEKTIKYCISIGIRPTVSFMAGFPIESISDINSSLEMILNLSKLKAKVQLTLLSILPGTKLFNTHLKELTYDGYQSDFSRIVLSKKEETLIKSNVRLFSSFYHLPIIAADRNLLILISTLVNHVNFFTNTIHLLLTNHLIINSNLVKEIEKIYKVLQNSDELEDDNNYFIEVISRLNEMFNLIPNSSVLKEVFGYEVIQFLNTKKFTRFQLINPRIENNSKDDLRNIVTPYWDLVESKLDFNNLFLHNQKNDISFTENSFKYLVVASNEKYCTTYLLDKIQYEQLQNVKTQESHFVGREIAVEDFYITQKFKSKLLKVGVLI